MSKDHEYLYPYSAQEAKKRNQLSMWRESYHVNVACRNAIEETIRQNFDLRCDDTFVEDEGWHIAAERYSEFLRRHKGLKTLFLDLGTGMNTPTIVKFSFWRMANEWPDATYACINLGEAYAPKEIEAKSICINADIGSVLKQI